MGENFKIKATENELEALCKVMKDIAVEAYIRFDECDPTAGDYQTEALTYEAWPKIKEFADKTFTLNFSATPKLFRSVYNAFDVSYQDGEGSCDLPKGTTELEIKIEK